MAERLTHTRGISPISPERAAPIMAAPLAKSSIPPGRSFARSSASMIPAPRPTTDPINRPTDLSREVMNRVLEQDTPFDVRVIIQDILDDRDFFEVSGNFAKNLVTGFGHLGAWPVGIIANQSIALSGNL